jgi:mycothiol synthase
MLRIDEFTASEGEYAGLVDVHNGAWPDEPTTLAAVKHRDASRSPERYFRRVIGRIGDRIVAAGSAMESVWSYRPGKYHVDIDIHAGFESGENRAQIYDVLVDALDRREPAPVLLTANAREDKDDQVRFLTDRGFVSVMRYPRSRLLVDEFDFAPYAGLIERVESGGIAISSLSGLMKRDPDWQRKMYDLDWAGTQDEPTPEPITQLPFEEYVQRIFEGPEFLPEGNFIAVDGDEYVALSSLERDLARPDHLETGFTCTRRSHRRRNIAMALKLKAIAFAKEYGAKTIDTGNEENNPMYQINLKLGFRPRPAWSDYHKTID